MERILFLRRYQSPLGTYILVSSRQGVACVKTEKQSPAFFERWEREKAELREDAGHNDELASQLDAYFAGKLRGFSVPLDLKGTLFQLGVWNLLRGIRYGETRSYRQIAEALGRPQAARAVGRAVGTNPVAIVVPCHRVVGSDGRLTGYGGGLERKEALLSLEAAHS